MTTETVYQTDHTTGTTQITVTVTTAPPPVGPFAGWPPPAVLCYTTPGTWENATAAPQHPANNSPDNAVLVLTDGAGGAPNFGAVGAASYDAVTTGTAGSGSKSGTVASLNAIATAWYQLGANFGVGPTAPGTSTIVVTFKDGAGTPIGQFTTPFTFT